MVSGPHEYRFRPFPEPLELDGMHRRASLAVERLDLGGAIAEDGLEEVSGLTVFGGPHHLATLLTQVAQDVLGRAVVDLDVPSGLGGRRWRRYLRQLARRKPYLWPNHAAAIRDGYLDSGTSSVLGLPTGAGKSMLAELKVAVALQQGSKVV